MKSMMKFIEVPFRSNGKITQIAIFRPGESIRSAIDECRMIQEFHPVIPDKKAYRDMIIFLLDNRGPPE